MASITVRNLEDNVKTRLRARAAGNGRSLEEEARWILREAAGGEAAPKNLAAFTRPCFAPLGGVDLELPPRGSTRSLAVSFMVSAPLRWAAVDPARVHGLAVLEAERRASVAGVRRLSAGAPGVVLNRGAEARASARRRRLRQVHDRRNAIQRQ